MRTWEPRCRAGHRNCTVGWGYDEAHTDSPRPYTLDELAARTAPPHRFAYPSVEEYVDAFHLWRSLRRDAEQTHAERDIVWRWRVTEMAHQLGKPELVELLDQITGRES